MPATLDEWQQHLAEHFVDVTLHKLDLPHEPVTFALEHGLDVPSRSALSNAIQLGVKSRTISSDHYLCWTTYASEIGYRYAGDEYWYTFKEQTPGWDQRDRPFIKSCFVKFSREYNGAVPRGSWARHFSIICWPITHAILPNDLQRQLAEILYRIRHSVVMDEVDSPGQLGRLIASHSLGTTTRFQQLASETELIGQIASALLRDDRSGEWIEPQTLARITADLNMEEQARSWLNDAKYYISRRAKVKGLRRPTTATPEDETPDVRAPQPRIRPSMKLLPQHGNAWRLVIETPNLNPLVRYYPNLQPLFSQANLHVGNHTRRYLARALLHSSLSVPQSVWPSPRTPLLSFEPSNDDLDALIAHTCTLQDGPWLFRLGVDGIGRQILSRRVSSGGDYIVAQEAHLSAQEFGEPVDLGCDGVTARKFTVNSSEDIGDQLHAWRLEPARSVIARPCGLVPAGWDREGAAEWLSTERPVVHLSANYALSNFEASIDTGSNVLTVMANPSAENSTFLVLPQLPAGVYHLKVIAHPLDSSYRTEQGEMEIAIRDVSTSEPTGVAMLVTQEPIAATFEELFEGKVKVQVLGPTSRSVSITLRLKKKGRADALFVTEESKLALPVSERVFSKYIDKLLEVDSGLSRAYSQADRCELVFDGDDLGTLEYQYDRSFTPLRWGISRSRDAYAITLYDDVDDPASIEVYRYEFSTPLKQRALGATDLSKAAQGPALPGLYLARTRNDMAASIVPAQSFNELRSIKPRFFRPERTPESIDVFLSTIDNWSRVDTRGNLYGRYAWRVALRALIQQLVGLVSGSIWYKAERAYDRDNDLAALSRRIAYKRFGVGWSELLIEAVDDVFNKQIPARIARLAEITRQPAYLCEFALRLASDPSSIRDRSSGQFNSIIRQIMHRSELTRAARLLVLGTASKLEASQDSGRTIYQGWQWK